MCTPGTDVGIAWKGPPVSVSGLGSHVSSWLTPPESQKTTQRFRCEASCSAARACTMPEKLIAPSAPAAPLRNVRRDRCSADPHAYLPSMTHLTSFRISSFGFQLLLH